MRDHDLRRNGETFGTRSLDVAHHVRVDWVPKLDAPDVRATIEYREWVFQRLQRDTQLGVWLTVNDGVIESIIEQAEW